jgi:hypothetical protein
MTYLFLNVSRLFLSLRVQFLRVQFPPLPRTHGFPWPIANRELDWRLLLWRSLAIIRTTT